MVLVFDSEIIFLVTATFFVAGLVKGVVGLGLPTISLALLTVTTNLPTAMLLLIMPSIVTNVWQALSGAYLKLILKKYWAFFLLCVLFVPLGGMALNYVKLTYLSSLLGGLLIIYSTAELMGHSFNVSLKFERLIGLTCGSLTGLLTGMTGSCVFPGVMFLQAIGLQRDMLVQTMGVLFTLSTLSLGISLHLNNFLSLENGLWSNLGIVPAVIGMVLGKKIRKWLPQEKFRFVFFLAIFLLGSYIVFKSVY